MTVLMFSERCRHARTSTKVPAPTGSRAASNVILSAVRPLAIAVPDVRIALHHSDGMLSRCHHLLTADAPAPISDAMASREDHSSMIERNEVGSLIPAALRHLVLNVKDGVSSDCQDELSDNVHMAHNGEEDLYTKQLVLRTRAARNARVPKTTQDQIADLLHIDQTTYSKYESPGRPTRMPHELIWAFCNLCGIQMEWFLTGRGKGLPVESMAIFEKKNIRSRKQRKKAKAA